MARPRKAQPKQAEVKQESQPVQEVKTAQPKQAEVKQESQPVQEVKTAQPKQAEVKPLTKVKNIRGGDVSLFDVLIKKDGFHEFDESKLSERQVKQLAHSIKCKLIEKV